MAPRNAALLALAGVPGLRGRALWPHVPEPSGQPPMNASDAAFADFRAEVLRTMHDAMAAPGWVYAADTGDGVRVGRRTDPDSGCPWVRGEAMLYNVSIARAADYIVTDPRPTEWSPGYNASDTPFRALALANGSMGVRWHWEHDSAFLRDRAYWAFGAWQWVEQGVIEDCTVAFHGDLPPPPGLPTGVRHTEWALHRLTAAETGVRYEVLWYEDLDGIVPCTLTVADQQKSMRKEVAVYRRVLPVVAGPLA